MPEAPVFIPVFVEISELGLPRVLPVGTFALIPGTTEINWVLITLNSHTPSQATFNSPAIQFLDPVPDGVTPTLPLVTNDLECTLSIANDLEPFAQSLVNYRINYIFEGQPFTHDPVIVVTSEPITPMSS